MIDQKYITKIIENRLEYENRADLAQASKMMFEFATTKGLPPEMFKDKIKEHFNDDELLFIIDSYFGLLLEHKFKSGLEFNGKQHKKFQDLNNKVTIQLIETGDFDTI